MYPILFRIDVLVVSASSVFLVLGILAGFLVGWKESKRVGFSNRDVFLFAALAIPVALFLGILNGYVFRLILYRDSPVQFELFQSGMVSFGVVLGMFTVSWLQSRLSKLPPAKGLDMIALVLPLILAIFRIGCLLNGCCYGRETDGFLGLYLPGDFSEWAYRYPTQIMLMVFDWALFAFLWMRRRHREFDGSQAFAFLLIYPAGRLVIDSFRDLPPVAFGLSIHQLTAIAMFLVTLTVLLLRLARGRAA